MSIVECCECHFDLTSWGVCRYDPYLPPAVAQELNTTLIDSPAGVFEKCTHVSVHCLLTDETRGMVNEEMIKRMPGVSPDGVKCGNHLNNVARGGIVDEVRRLLCAS